MAVVRNTMQCKKNPCVLFCPDRQTSNMHYLDTLGLAVRAEKATQSWRVVTVQLKLYPHLPRSAYDTRPYFVGGDGIPVIRPGSQS